MSDEATERPQTFEEELLNRLAQRVGVLTAQVDALTIENERLRAAAKPVVDPALNGEAVVT